MNRKRILQVVLGIFGLLFFAAVLALMQFNDPGKITDQMLAAIYATLGVFLLLAIRNPSAHRSLIAFAGWSNLAHGTVMAIQAYRHLIPPRDLLVAVLPISMIGIILVALTPPKERTATSGNIAKSSAMS